MKIRQTALQVQDHFFHWFLTNNLRNCNSVLDVGCGTNSPVGKIHHNFYSEGIDIFKKSIAISKKKKFHNKYVLGDIRELHKYYKNKSFDAVVCIDVIEHLTLKEAHQLITNMEKIARKKVIILTPNGFYSQGHLDHNPYQEHISGWQRHDFEKLGYHVYGLRGLKFLRDDHASIRFKPWLFWGFCSMVSEVLFHWSPDLSFDLIAVKSI